MDALIDLLGRAESKRQDYLAGKLTLKQIETLAQKTHIPFGYFFLDTPPKIVRNNSLPDLRQLPEFVPLSADFFDTLDDVLRKQQWFIAYLKAQTYNNLDFVARFKNTSVSAQKIAEDIRNTLNFTHQEQAECANAQAFFNLLSTKAEAAGVLVFKNGIVKNNTHRSLSVAEFRGFAIVDKLAPVIFINGKDSEAAWVFTLAHELAHIWLGESGIFNLPYEQPYHAQQLEKDCNQIAAELLVPETLFLNAWEQQPDIVALSKVFNVSVWVIARRAYDFNKITREQYKAVLNTSKKTAKSGGGDFYKILPTRNSKRITQAIVSSALSGNMMLREAASLLNVQPHTIMELSKRHLS
ncbi:ImmA/IrrE family metallo-endopeptidase [Beggiatoa leptomitoformis]|uniref:ImmA/IrrE family metallo-endopeptidase n=2 Tax=Beggiatoa leptomitoformis TaxID=288004 RepID=A0A2N9YIY5_9GAMM|nr:ImmA/IrrE family metallo-endopeptidase [Beggiatoa leptomitoformis]AUI70467.1 ImmA/IrrE family metallo-endopeptidase [Beggiatoa leptomitoformis]